MLNAHCSSQKNERDKTRHSLTHKQRMKFPSWLKISSKSNNDISLKNLLSNIESLVHNYELFKGWKRKQLVLMTRHLRATSNLLYYNIILRKVNTKDLIDLSEPILNQHHKILSSEKKIWHQSYKEEYTGLQKLDT